MYRKVLPAVLFIMIALASYSRAGGVISGTVLEVTPDAIKIKSDLGKTATYEISNGLLTNTSHAPDIRGKITEIQPGCKILCELGPQAGKSVIVAIEVAK